MKNGPSARLLWLGLPSESSHAPLKMRKVGDSVCHWQIPGVVKGVVKEWVRECFEECQRVLLDPPYYSTNHSNPLQHSINHSKCIICAVRGLENRKVT